MSKVKDSKIDGVQVLQDPMPINGNIDVSKSGTAYSIRLKAKEMQARGLGGLQIEYLRVTRFFGLRDLRINATVSTHLNLNGAYNLQVLLSSIVC